MVELPRRKLLLSVFWGLLLLLGGAGQAAAEDVDVKDPTQLWTRGVAYFDRGEFTKAKDCFDRLIELVDENVAAKLVERAGIKAMVEMLSSTEVGRAPKIVWDLYSKYSRKKLVDQEIIERYVNIAIDEKSHEVTRQEALHQLRRIGQYAVPELAKHMGDSSDERRSLVRIALRYIGQRGTLALVQLVDTGEDLFKETLALALSDITPSDVRAVPALKRLYDNPKVNATVKEKVAYSLHKITGLNPADMAGFADYYYLLANRFYMEESSVPEEALESDGVVWELDKENKLVFRRVPVYSWNEEIAEDLAYECLTSAPEYDRMFPLLLSTMLAQREEVEAIKDAMKILGPRPTMTDDDIKILGERDKLMMDAQLLAQSCGPRYVYRAVGKAMRDERPLVCAAACDLLPLLDRYGDLLPPKAPPVELDRRGRPVKRREPKRGRKDESLPDAAPGGVPVELVTAAEKIPEHEGQPLVDALGSENDGVRFSAAIALAKMNPPKPFPSSEKVVAALADAISKAGPLQILVAEEDDDAFKLVKPRIEELGWGVSRATSGRDCINQAASFPPKDLILLSTKLKADLPVKAEKEGEEDVLGLLAGSVKMSMIPVALLVKQDEIAAEQAKFGRMSMISRILKGNALKDEIFRALGKAGPGITKQKREAMAARAGNALLAIDPRHTQLNVADAADACQKALFNRPDPVRNPCIRALGLFRVTAAAADVAKVFNDKDNTVELRASCLYALGQTAPDEYKELFVKAMNEEAAFELRNEAAIAYGKSQLTPDSKDLSECMQKIRLPRTQVGGDGRPDMHKGGAAAAAPAPAAPAPAPAAENN